MKFTGKDGATQYKPIGRVIIHWLPGRHFKDFILEIRECIKDCAIL